MNPKNRTFDQPLTPELERVIEPLASYICAAERPQRALMSALEVLLREVEATNRAASTYFRRFSAN